MNNDQIRQPPHSVEAEQAVIGGLMLSPVDAIIAVQYLEDSDFYRREHQLIYRAIRELSERDEPYDAVTLGDWFESQGLSEQVGAHYLVDLASTTPSAANIDAYAKIVKEHAVKRSLIQIGTEMVNRGFNCAASNDIIADGMSALATSASSINLSNRMPLDLFGDYEYPPLNKDWLPPGVGNYAYDQADIIGVAPEMLAIGCLATIGAAMSDNFQLKVKGNEKWSERSRLWFMVIAPPGSKKSIALNRPLSPLLRRESEMKHRYSQAITKFDVENKVHQEKQRAAVKREARGEGLEETLERPERPANNRVTVNNITTEMLGELLADNPRGLHWYSDEISIWFGQHDAYRNGGGGVDRGIALQAFDGKAYTFDRIGRGTITVPNLSYSLLGTTQPDKIKATVKDMSDDGLLQRFITIEVPTETRYGEEDRHPNAEYEAQWENAVETMWIWGEQDRGGIIQMSEGADRVRREFSRWVTRVSSTDGLPPMLRGHVAKWEAMFPRLLLCYHAFGCAASKKYITSLPVSEKTALRVQALMKKFLLPHAMRFYGNTISSGDETFTLAKKVASMILGNGLTRIANRDMQHHLNAWKIASEQQKVGAINMLKESAWLLGADSKRATGVESGWAVSPAVHAQFKSRADVERARISTAASILREMRGLRTGED